MSPLLAELRLQRPGFTLDVALALPARGVTALFGPSGCGKTTLLRALAGLERAQGRVQLGDLVWQDDTQGHWTPTHQRPLGYVIQEAALFPHLDVRENLVFGQRRAGTQAREFALDAVIELLGIGPLLARRPATLSGGERQRVAIARALATAPRLLLMDEPLAALDAARKAEVLPYLERLQRECALPIVYVTHALDEAARLADHLVLMDAGRALATGPLAELLARPELPLSQLDEAGVLIEAHVAEHDTQFGLSRITFAGGQLWVGATTQALGTRVRARVLARDVSVTRHTPQESSVLNLLPVQLLSLHPEGHTVLLRLQPVATADGPSPTLPGSPPALLARITQRSAHQLALRAGERLCAQVKGVALMSRGA